MHSEDSELQSIKVDRFFTMPSDASPEVVRVANSLKRLNLKTGFITEMINKEGYAIWNKSLFNSNFKKLQKTGNSEKVNTITDTILYIPLVLENTTYVNSFIYARLNGDIHLSLYRGKEYAKYGFGNLSSDSTHNAERLALQIMMLEKEVFGHKEFFIKDSRLFKNENQCPLYSDSSKKRIIKIDEEVPPNSSSRFVEGTVTTCTWGPVNDCHGCIGQCDNCPLCTKDDWTCVTTIKYYFISDDNEQPSGGINNSPVGNTGGATTGNPSNPPPTQCNPSPQIDNGLLPCSSHNNTGWTFEIEEIFPDLSNVDSDNDNNYTTGDYDNTLVPNFDIQTQQWPTIGSVIPISQFVEYDRRNCLTLAKEQIAKKGYKISGYGDASQTFITYTVSTGVNKTAAKDGVSYLISALQRNIPVIVGVDYKTGPSPGNADNTTDHFIVIVGMGTDATGNYFLFYDNATNLSSKGASSSNKLYYDPSTGLIKGQTACTYSDGTPLPIYTVTQIRKSK